DPVWKSKPSGRCRPRLRPLRQAGPREPRQVEGLPVKYPPMGFTVKVRSTEHVTILDASGTLTVCDPVGQLRETLQSLLKNGERKFILNLAEVSYIDSSG